MMDPLTRLELVALVFEARRSDQLSYKGIG
jgi:hypothetical protein